jgi:hypothetical protein
MSKNLTPKTCTPFLYGFLCLFLPLSIHAHAHPLPPADSVICACPATALTVQDVSNNDAQLWNESYWIDPLTSQNDLADAPTELALFLPDSCAGDIAAIRYLLFLDLDGNGSRETVIDSDNPPAAGKVLFNNVNTPNYAGGTERSFDGRPLSDNQKYRFSLEWNAEHAQVRWNTLLSPAVFSNPELPYGNHRIEWVATDGNGDTHVCAYDFLVKDTKAPTVVCLGPLSVNIMPTGIISLWATDFLQYATDNYTPADMFGYGIRKAGSGSGFPVDSLGNPQVKVEFNCTELGTQFVEIWGRDKAGNAGFCENYVIIQDNLGNCPGGQAIIIGNVATEQNVGVKDVSILFNGYSNAVPAFTLTTQTDEDGNYSTAAIPFSSTTQVCAEKDDNPQNGVSTYDLVLLSKHILGIEPLNSPYKRIAADINRSGSITNFDIVECRKLILGIYNAFPNSPSWRFIDKSYVFPNPNNPFQSSAPACINLFTTFPSTADFVAIKVGDLNGSVVPNVQNVPDDRDGNYWIDVTQQFVHAGEEIEVPFKAAATALGCQFTLEFPNMDLLGLTPAADLKADHFGIFPHRLTASYNGDSLPEFTLRLRALSDGYLSEQLSISDQITHSEAYQDHNLRYVVLRFNLKDGSAPHNTGFDMQQNTPNPFGSATAIPFYMPKAGKATLRITDAAGQTLHTQSADFQPGSHYFQVNAAQLGSTGILQYTIETADGRQTKMMIRH